MKFLKVFEKITFPFSKVNFSLLEIKIFLKKVDFFSTFVQMNVLKFWHIDNYWCTYRKNSRSNVTSRKILIVEKKKNMSLS